MINIFGGNYDEIGSTNKNLILKTQGKIKIQWGKKFIDLVDNDGNINSKLQKLINKVNSLDDISKDGFYIYDGSLYVKYGDDILPLQNQDSDALYVSFVTEQETTSEQKYTALKNLGLVYPTLSNVNNIPTNGIIYNEYDKSLYIIDNGVLSKYYLEIPNPYTKQFVITKEDDSNGALVINGEGIENSLYFNDLQIYNQQAYAYYKSLKDHKFYVGNQSVVNITGSGIETNEIKSKGFSYDTGYAIQQEGSDYILYIDDIHVRKGIKAEAIKNIIPVRIYKEENVIIDSKVISGPTDSKYTLDLYFKYPDTYQDEDILRIYIEAPYEEVNKAYPIDLKVTQTHTTNVPPVKLNYVVVEYTIDNNHPNNVLEYINNTVCYLYSRKTQTGVDINDDPIYTQIVNEDLVIGDLSGYTGSNNKTYGIISKNNKFYSAKFDKDGENNPNIFPIYSNDLYDELYENYTEGTYDNVIPPIGFNKQYYIGTCSTAGLNKQIILTPNTTKFNVRSGTILKVIFSVDNSGNASTNSPVTFTIKYNYNQTTSVYDSSFGPNSVQYLNTIKQGSDTNIYGKAGESITYIYDGTTWNWLSGKSDGGGLNAILNDINIQNEQDVYMPRDSINNTSNNHDSTYHRDYIFTYAGIGLASNNQEIYKYRWIPIPNPNKGILIYNPLQQYNKFEVISPGTNNQYLKCTINNQVPSYSWDTPSQGGEGSINNPSTIGQYIYTFDGSDQAWLKINNLEDLINSVITLKQQKSLSNLDIMKNNSSIVGNTQSMNARDTIFTFDVKSNATWKSYQSIRPSSGNGNQEDVEFSTGVNGSNNSIQHSVTITDFFNEQKQIKINQLAPVNFEKQSDSGLDNVSSDGGIFWVKLISSFTVETTECSIQGTVTNIEYQENGNSGIVTITFNIPQNLSNRQITQNCDVRNTGGQVCQFIYTQQA